MPERRDSLSPPARRDTVDPGAHELEASDSEEHYSDAQSGPVSPVRAPSPIPRTRVERVDDRPAYGEVPGTQAYRMREEDAEPDEIAIIPDSSDPTPAEPEPVARPPTPGGHPIPKTVVEESPDGEGAVTHPETRQRRKSDAHPDVVVKADGQRVEERGAANDQPPVSPSLSTPPASPGSRRRLSLGSELSPLSPGLPGHESSVSAAEDGDKDDDEFGDDFDDFEEGGEDGDFGDFNDGFQQAEHTPAPVAASPPPPPGVAAAPTLSFPIPCFDDLDPAEIHALTQSYLDALFPLSDNNNNNTASPPSSLLLSATAKDNPNAIFLTPRSASLWSQLVAPPPLQPPDWIRSRIRRLFLVSLGVPVDLDEILPAWSKQKKLVLPSVHRTSSSGSLRRASSDSRAQGGRQGGGGGGGGGGDDGTGAVGGDGRGGSGKGKRADGIVGGGGGESPERDFDLVSARQRCMLTDAALTGMTDEELKEHIRRLQAMQGTAQAVLTYWQKRTDEKIGDREAFEGVIASLVKHAQKVRK